MKRRDGVSEEWTGQEIRSESVRKKKRNCEGV